MLNPHHSIYTMLSHLQSLALLNVALPHILYYLLVPFPVACLCNCKQNRQTSHFYLLFHYIFHHNHFHHHYSQSFCLLFNKDSRLNILSTILPDYHGNHFQPNSFPYLERFLFLVIPVFHVALVKNIAQNS